MYKITFIRSSFYLWEKCYGKLIVLNFYKKFSYFRTFKNKNIYYFSENWEVVMDSSVHFKLNYISVLMFNIWKIVFFILHEAKE